MTEKRDYYDVLGVNKNASVDEIKKAYRQKTIQLHPDKQQGKTDEEKKASEEEFKLVVEANEILSDPNRRTEYDQFGFSGRSGQGFGMNMDDIMAEMMRNMNPFGNMNGGFSNRTKYGGDIRIQINVSLEEVFSGTHKVGKYKRKVKCPDCQGKRTNNINDVKTCPKCQGSGMYRQVTRQGNMIFQSDVPCPDCNATGKIISNPCHKCHGEGLITVDETIEMNIPNGVEDNMSITFKGKGHMVPLEGIDGHLIVVIRVKPHEKFDKQGSTIYALKELSIIDCISGISSTILGIDGNTYKFKVRQGTMNGEQYRIIGKGLPIINTDKRGDLIVIIKQNMPKSLNNEEIELLTKLKEMPHFKSNNDE